MQGFWFEHVLSECMLDMRMGNGHCVIKIVCYCHNEIEIILCWLGMSLATMTPPGRCGMAVFANCSTYMSYVNITDDGQVHIDKDALLNFYCGYSIYSSSQYYNATIATI